MLLDIFETIGQTDYKICLFNSPPTTPFKESLRKVGKSKKRNVLPSHMPGVFEIADIYHPIKKADPCGLFNYQSISHLCFISGDSRCSATELTAGTSLLYTVHLRKTLISTS